MRITKEYLYNITVGDFYGFRVYKVTDAAKQVWYIGEPVDRGATKLGDTIEELREKLEAEVPILNKYLAKTK